jgi:hypothetical protein
MNTHTWADGFGTWHAEVTENGTGNARNARRSASNAIARELTDRAPRGVTLRAPIKLRSRTSRDGTLVSEFVENWPA